MITDTSLLEWLFILTLLAQFFIPKHKRKLFYGLALLFLALNLVIRFYQFDRERKQQAQIDTMTKELIEINTDLLKKDSLLNLVKNDVTSVRQYAHVAKLDPLGRSMIGGKNFKISTPLIEIMEHVWEERENNRLELILTSEAETYARKAIKEYPYFPFSHYVKRRQSAAKLLINGRGERSRSPENIMGKVFDFFVLLIQDSEVICSLYGL